MKKETSRLVFLYFLFCAIAFFLYRHCVHTHFLDDSFSAFYDYKLQGAKGFLKSFDFPSLYYGHDLFYFGFYFLFGLNDLAWHILFVLLYCLNTLLIFKVAETALSKLNFINSTAAAFIACLFFLVSPYQTENMIWVATMHYQIAMLCLFSGILLIIQNKTSLFWLHLFFAVSLLTLEITFVFPAIWVITFLVFRKSVAEALKKIIAPQVFIIIFYFISMKLIKGFFMPHYGVEHLEGWSPVIIFSTLLKYFFKLFGFVHFMEYAVREKAYAWCDDLKHVFWVWGTVIASLSFLAIATRFKREAKLVIVLLLFAFLVLLPVLNMYFMFLSSVENDRLSFFATPFLYLTAAFLITRFPAYVYLPISIGILLLMKKLLGLYTWYWINAATVQQHTLDSYRWFDKEKVYILNLPQNFNGAYIYRKGWRFGSAMLVKNDKNILKQIETVAGQNMFDMNDGVSVTAKDSVTYLVSKNGWGWFWRGPLGAYDYETDDFVFKLEEKSYTVKFKHPLKESDVVVYQNGGNWEEANKFTQ
ncbi:MAG: hypothetical protein NTY88_04590 [Bacteroidetes bacterium]|nr:hypothetical protein [Bacteroidota bacterium]